MACRCQRRECACGDCPECRHESCRCCADAALAVLPPDDLVHAHNAHMTALAHLELALAALNGSKTEKLTWTDWAKQKVKTAHDSVKAAATKLKDAVYTDNKKAIQAVMYKVVKPIADSSVGREIAKSRLKAVASAIKGGSEEHTTATAEHDAHDKEFERRRQEEDALAAKAKHSPPKIGPHGYEVGDI
jgi:hypothetical protein